MSDWPGLLAAFLYIFGVIAVAEALRRRRGYSRRFIGQLVHIAVGMWIVGTIRLFQNRYVAVLPFISLALFNLIVYLSHRSRPGEQDYNSPGSIYLPISLTFMTLLLWKQPGLLVASLMPLVWGDPLGAIMGYNYGQYHYQILGRDRTLEGSLSVFIFGMAALLIAMLVFLPLGFWTILLYSFLVALTAAGVEAASPWGMDNLFVPVVSGALLRLLIG